MHGSEEHSDWEMEQCVEHSEEKLRIITKITGQKKNRNRVSIFLDGDFAFGIPRPLVVKFLLHTGMRLDPSKEKEILERAQFIWAKEVALNYLSYKARTEQEVRNKLSDKGFDEKMSEEVIERFRELGYLNDESYAQSFTFSRLRGKGRGPRRIRRELQQKGVDDEFVDAAIELLEQTKDLIAEIRPRAAKRWEKLRKEPDKYKRRNKFQEYLVRQGFDFGIARQLLDEFQAADAELPKDEEADEMEEIQTAEDFLPLAEKHWRRVSRETNPFKRKKKFTDAMRRKGVPYPIVKEFFDTFLEEEAQEAQEAEEEFEPNDLGLDEEEMEDEDPLEEIRPIAINRWEKLCRTESNKWKRKKKWSEQLMRKGFSFSLIRLIEEELELNS